MVTGLLTFFQDACSFLWDFARCDTGLLEKGVPWKLLWLESCSITELVVFKNIGSLLLSCLRRANYDISLGLELRFVERA